MDYFIHGIINYVKHNTIYIIWHIIYFIFVSFIIRVPLIEYLKDSNIYEIYFSPISGLFLLLLISIIIRVISKLMFNIINIKYMFNIIKNIEFFLFNTNAYLKNGGLKASFPIPLIPLISYPRYEEEVGQINSEILRANSLEHSSRILNRMSTKWLPSNSGDVGKYPGIFDSMQSTSKTCHEEALALLASTASKTEYVYMKYCLSLFE